MRQANWHILTVLVASVLFQPPASACTAFSLKAADGTIIATRSMEFGVDLQYDLIVVPRNHPYASPGPNGAEGLAWKTRYGFVGVAQFGKDYGISDGMNEKGLGFGMLWFEADMKWQDVAPGEERTALAQLLMGDWLLGNFASVEDVRRELPKIKVFHYTDPATKLSPTVHFIVYDAQGGCIVIEYENGGCSVYDDPLGIMTNAPRFPWQLANLRQYAGMSTESPAAFSMSGMTFAPTGHGAGMIGLPGDLTPPSRFVRLGVLTRFADVQPDAAKTLNLAEHVISSFDIPRGLVTDTMPDKSVRKETTQWIVFRDLTNRVLYFRTYDNFDLRKVALGKLDFAGPKVQRIPMFGTAEAVVDLTAQAR